MIQVQKKSLYASNVWWLTNTLRISFQLLFDQSNKTITENK